MILPRRKFLRLATTALSSLTGIVRAFDYPMRPVRFIVSFAAGGPNDTIARVLGQHLSEQLGQQVVVEDRVGAGGMSGCRTCCRQRLMDTPSA